MEQIRRVNRLWASDSLFLRENLLIPVPIDNQKFLEDNSPPKDYSTPGSSTNTSVSTSPAYDNEDATDFLIKIDSSIANTKEEVKKTQGNSTYVLSLAVYTLYKKI